MEKLTKEDRRKLHRGRGISGSQKSLAQGWLSKDYWKKARRQFLGEENDFRSYHRPGSSLCRLALDSVGN